MSSPLSADNVRGLSRPASHRKKVSSWVISIGPAFAMAAAFGAMDSTLAMRALISMFRAMGAWV
jgi:hypothetical protein